MKILTDIYRIILHCFIVVILSGCGDAVTELALKESQYEPPPEVKLNLNAGSGSEPIDTDDYQEVSVEIYYNQRKVSYDGDIFKDVVYEYSEPEILTIDKSGNIIPRKTGTTSIRAVINYDDSYLSSNFVNFTVTEKEKPDALFNYSPAIPSINMDVLYNAGESYDRQDGKDELLFRWDFDGDGIFDTSWSSETGATHRFFNAGEYSSVLQVKDTDNNTAELSASVQVSNITTDGLVAYYPFSGNANDMSGNNHNASVSGAEPTEDRFGNQGFAYSFDGIDDYIVVPSGFELEYFTISAWINSEGDYSTSHEGEIGMRVGYYATSMSFSRRSDNGGEWCVVMSTYPDKNCYLYSSVYHPLNNGWYHVCFTYKNGIGIAYVNGMPEFSYDWTDLLTAPYYNTLKADFFIGKSGDDNFFLGNIDDIRVYDRALNSDCKPARKVTTHRHLK